MIDFVVAALRQSYPDACLMTEATLASELPTKDWSAAVLEVANPWAGDYSEAFWDTMTEADDMIHGYLLYQGLQSELAHLLVDMVRFEAESQTRVDGHYDHYLIGIDAYGPNDVPVSADLKPVIEMLVLRFGDYGTSPRYGWIAVEDGLNNHLAPHRLHQCIVYLSWMLATRPRTVLQTNGV